MPHRNLIAVWLVAHLLTLCVLFQTELGHGSFVRGLETTATYDPTTQEFVLNTPTLTATKWWPGSLGRHATHCVLMAKLISLGKDHGLHAFYLPLRDTRTYELLPGRVIGDIGPKMGYESNDNGFLRLENVRIPRFNHFARMLQLDAEGNLNPVKGTAQHAKMNYLTMVYTRSMIVLVTSSQLAKAITIAIRYSCVRKQFPDHLHPQRGEAELLAYQTQQHTLLGLLATTFAFHFTGSFMRKLYFDSAAKMNEGDASVLPELHATSSGLKALTTGVASNGIEEARRACGGHGYSRFSGIVDLYLDYVPAQTYEGDNIVMFLQTARSLLKMYGQVHSRKFTPAAGSQTGYMLGVKTELGRKSELKDEAELLSANLTGRQAQISAYKHRLVRLLTESAAAMADSMKRQKEWTFEQHWEGLKVQNVRLARAHCQYVLVLNFHAALENVHGSDDGPLDPAVQSVLRLLCDLYCWMGVLNELGDFTEDGYLSQKQCGWIRARVLSLLAEIRPNAVTLVDSFDFTDFHLNSALGRYDGDVYTSLYEWAQRNPMNNADQQRSGTGIQEHIIPMFAGKPFSQKSKL